MTYLLAKQKKLYKSVQTKAGILNPTWFLLDMKVHWSSTYVIINYAEDNKEVSLGVMKISIEAIGKQVILMLVMYDIINMLIGHHRLFVLCHSYIYQWIQYMTIKLIIFAIFCDILATVTILGLISWLIFPIKAADPYLFQIRKKFSHQLYPIRIHTIIQYSHIIHSTMYHLVAHSIAAQLVPHIIANIVSPSKQQPTFWCSIPAIKELQTAQKAKLTSLESIPFTKVLFKIGLINSESIIRSLITSLYMSLHPVNNCVSTLASITNHNHHSTPSLL